MHDDEVPSEALLAVIRQEGGRRRARRYRRNALLAGAAVVVAVVAIAVPLTVGSPGHDDLVDRQAARDGCKASHDPRCSPAVWDPAPAADQPATAVLDPTVSTSVAAGQPLALRVDWADADAASATPVSVCWGDGACPTAPARCIDSSATGIWQPPPATAGDGFIRLDHTYAAAGTYQLAVVIRTSSWDRQGCPPLADPYGNDVTVTATITVT